MRNARRQCIWHPTGTAAGIGALLLLAAVSPGCGDDTTETTSTTTTSSGTGGGGGAGGGAGGEGGTGGTVQASINPAAEDVANPFDATPDPEGNNVYFTAADRTLGTGVFRVDAGGGPSSPISVGGPFSAPFGITISTDGAQLFVADPAAETGDTDAEEGQIFVVPAAGGAPSTLSGTLGTKPRGLEIVRLGGQDVLYFSGRNSAGAVGVFKMSPSGGNVAPVATGAPFIDPGAIAVAAPSGDVYVADTSSETTPHASILKIGASQTTATEIVSGLAVGYPVGIAVNQAGTTLIVSGLDPATRTDVLIVIDLATMQQSFFVGDADTNITAFEEPAGLHRARNRDVFAWTDSKAGNGGTVFTFNF